MDIWRAGLIPLANNFPRYLYQGGNVFVVFGFFTLSRILQNLLMNGYDGLAWAKEEPI